jgi:hypothetical protein
VAGVHGSSLCNDRPVTDPIGQRIALQGVPRLSRPSSILTSW